MVGDIWFVFWTLAWIWAAFKLHDLVMNLAAPGLAIRDGATSLGDSIASAGDSIGGVPLVGESLASPFEGMSSAAMAIADAGAAEAEAVSKLALFLSVALGIVAIASYAVVWIPIRIAFIRRATAAQKFVDADEDLDLFALRAMTRQPLHILARISDDPAGAWRRGDPAVVRALAALELRAEGLRLPTPLTDQT